MLTNVCEELKLPTKSSKTNGDIAEPVYAVHVHNILYSTTIIASSIAQSTQYNIIIIITNSLQETRCYLRCLDVVICDVCVDNGNINTTDCFTP